MNICIKRKNATVILSVYGRKSIDLPELISALEKAVIGKMLDRHNGTKAKVAENLSLKRTTLVEKARRYGFPIRMPY